MRISARLMRWIPHRHDPYTLITRFGQVKSVPGGLELTVGDSEQRCLRCNRKL